MGQDEVIAVAIVAGGRNDQPLLEQSDPMDTLGVVFKNIMFRYVIYAGNRRAFPVTFPAQEGDLHLVSLGIRVGIGQNIMLAVALGAVGSIEGLQFQGLAVDAGIELHLGIIMAIAAIHRLQHIRMRKLLHGGIFMTGGAVEVGVDAPGQGVLGHHQRQLLAPGCLGLEAGVAIEAERELKADEPHFAGHFPGRPIMPGVLITEALAQTAGLLIALTAMANGERVEGNLFYLARADMKWTTPVGPGETLVLEAKLDRALGSLVAFKVRASTRRKDVAIGTLTLAKVGG